MQLPTMVKQIGAVDGNEKVYIEDYVYAYLNELKAEKQNLPLRAALFGHVYHKENQIFYLVYGAVSIVDELAYGRSEEQVRKEYFEEYELIGYVNIYGNKQEVIKRLIYGVSIIILSIAVTTINDYKKMYGFVETAGRAAELAAREEPLP